MLTRRSFLLSASAVALAGGSTFATAAPQEAQVQIRPLPLSAVRLKPSIYATAVETNRRYLMSLSPDRLLHNFHKSAGLPPKGELYGGWESLGIAGHTLGHYLSALALTAAQTGDRESRERIRYIVAEMARIQAAHGDGYVGGTTVERDGKVLDGKIVFEEIRRGEIRTDPFAVNGGWVPLYTWHKVHAGLIDAVRIADVEEAMPVLVGMSDYLATILEGLSQDQMQRLLVAEHGGLNESYADTYALTGNPRYLRLAESIRHRAVLDPLTQGRDILPGLHANTQIPKLLGLARLYELTGDPSHSAAARFFHRTVTNNHSYVIGGNSEREFFGPPDVIAARLSDRTCEHCNSYNMLKLTRYLYSWQPDPALFDYFERTHLNHIMAQQHPDTGMFVYFMPLASGAKRTYSTPYNNFWCCVGSGMESHAKHGESIYWEDGRTLFVNLFIPSTLNWQERGLKLEMDSDYPFDDQVALTIVSAGEAPLPIALRLPGWASGAELRLNGRLAGFERRDGYATLSRRWRKGDRIELTLPMRVRVEPTPDDPRTVAFTSGPLVLAADLGPPTPVWEGPTPGMLGSDPLAALQPVEGRSHEYLMAGVPAALTLKPYFNQYDRRTAVYFPLYTQAGWAEEQRAFQAAQVEKAALDARTVDLFQPGEAAEERAHGLATNHSEFWSYAGRGSRQAWWGDGNFVEVTMDVAPGDVAPGPLALRTLYWGEDVNKDFDILIDGKLLAHEQRKAEPVPRFVAVEYPIPDELTRGKEKVRVRIEARETDAPFFELRTVTRSPRAPAG